MPTRDLSAPPEPIQLALTSGDYSNVSRRLLGPVLPFSYDPSIGGFVYTNTETAATSENIKSLLITNWGERVMSYNFGCNLIDFLFENNRDDELKEKIANRINFQISAWIPYVEIHTLNITFPEDNPVIPKDAIGVFIGFKIKEGLGILDTVIGPP